MKRIALAGLVVLLTWVAIPTARADFALKDTDRVVFFGNKVFRAPLIPMGVETYLRIRYPQLQTSFRTNGKHEAPMLKTAVQRFEREVVPFKPTVVVLSFVTDEVARNPFNEADFNRFKTGFTELLDTAQKTGARLYVLTPLCPDASQKKQLQTVNYVETIGKYAEAIRQLGKEKGATVVDWYAASQSYAEQHVGDQRLATTTDGAYPSTIGSAIAMTALLDAWNAEPCKTTIKADWNSDAASASTGQVQVTKVSDDKIQLKLSGIPIPWVVAKRGTATGDDWPGSKYCTIMLEVANTPDGGIMIKEAGGKNALPYLSQQLLQGTDMAFVGPLTKLDAVRGLDRWILEKYKSVSLHLEFKRKGIPEPEYQQAYDTYYLGADQYDDATDQIVLRQPKVMDVTLELSKAKIPGKTDRAKAPGHKKVGKRNAKKPGKAVRPGHKRGKAKKPTPPQKPAAESDSGE
ncbi:MAG: hypothetical protein GY842_13765 [bacterium]|nr:hypothetical protein [bacterium]